MRALGFALAICTAMPVFAQEAETLADIRRELTALNVQVQSLKSELSTTGAASPNVPGDVLQRVDGMEAALSRLTSKTEALENRINRIVTDGTNRIGDLEFRLVELEGGDLGTLGTTPTLGGDEGAAPAVAPSDLPESGGAELAVSEQQDFERAQEALAAGDFRGAAEQFEAFNQAYPGGPLSADAFFLQGEALGKAGDWNPAARAFLESFSGNPQSPRAPSALYNLGLALHELGQTSEACLMLTEVGTRFPSADEVLLANSARQNLNCS